MDAMDKSGPAQQEKLKKQRQMKISDFCKET